MRVCGTARPLRRQSLRREVGVEEGHAATGLQAQTRAHGHCVVGHDHARSRPLARWGRQLGRGSSAGHGTPGAARRTAVTRAEVPPGPRDPTTSPARPSPYGAGGRRADLAVGPGAASSHRDVAGARPTEDVANAPGLRDLRVGGRRVHLTAMGPLAEVMKIAAAHQLDDIVTHEADLEELLLGQWPSSAWA